MRLLYGVATVLAASVLHVAAAEKSNNLSLTDAITQMPPCAVRKLPFHALKSSVGLG